MDEIFALFCAAIGGILLNWSMKGAISIGSNRKVFVYFSVVCVAVLFLIFSIGYICQQQGWYST